MKLRRRIIPPLLAAAALSCGVAHAEQAPVDGEDGDSFRPWFGTLGVRFHSENLFEETALPHFSNHRANQSELPGLAGATGLRGLGLGGEWRPFRNGFRLNFAMYFDSLEPNESGEFRPSNLSEGTGSATNDLFSLTRDFEAVPYVGLGWGANDGGLDVNLNVGTYLPRSAGNSLRGTSCLNPGGTSLAGCGSSSFTNSPARLPGVIRKSDRDFEWYPVVSLGLEYRF